MNTLKNDKNQYLFPELQFFVLQDYGISKTKNNIKQFTAQEVYLTCYLFNWINS